jgi:hypothetical protein
MKKLFFWILLGLSVEGFAFWLMATSLRQNPAVTFLSIMVFVMPPIGAFWMMYMAIRYEQRPVPLICLALFFPYCFVWYYFERVRPGKLVRTGC